MKEEITEYVNVEERVKILGCNMPSGVTVLPKNFHSASSRNDFIYGSLDLELRDNFRNNGLQGSSLEENENQPVLVELKESAIPEWIPPIVFVASPLLLDLLLNILSNFIYDKLKTIFAGKPNPPNTIDLCSFVVKFRDFEYKKTTIKAPYDSNLNLKSIKKMISKITEIVPK